VLPSSSALAADSEPPAASNPTKILESFARQEPQRAAGVTVISIGAVLLTLLIGTATVGIAVAVFGKPLFLVHMILAGLTVTVALIHVVVGLVWFYPF
jgi:Flp pilus assembly protein TadB